MLFNLYENSVSYQRELDMSLAKYMSVRRSFFFMIGGLVVLIIYLYFFIGIKDITFVLSHINSSQYAFYYSLALLAVMGSVFFWSAAWKTIMNRVSINVSYRRAYMYYWVGYFVDLVIPCITVCGELTRLYLVQTETKKNYGAVAAAAITNRIVAYTIVTIGLYTGGALVILQPGISPVVSNIFILFIVGDSVYMGVLLYLAFVKQAAQNLSTSFLKLQKIFRPKKYLQSDKEKTEESLSSFYSGFQMFRENPKLLVRPLILHGISYLLGFSVFVLIFYALGTPVSSAQFYIIIFFIATAFQDATASFSVGSLEILLATIFLFYGINPGISGVAAVVLRSASFWFPLLVGFLCLQIIGARNLLETKPEDLEKRLETNGIQSEKEGNNRERNHVSADNLPVENKA